MVEPLNAPSMILSNWLIQSVTYDGARRILELEMNTGERFQHREVPRRFVIGLVQADDPAKYMREFIDGTYQFERVRVERHRIACYDRTFLHIRPKSYW
jgi:KTSC domain